MLDLAEGGLEAVARRFEAALEVTEAAARAGSATHDYARERLTQEWRCELMMVLDRSSSMTGIVAGTGQTACALVKTDAAAFVNYFAPGRDRLGLVVFGSAAYVYLSTTSFTTPDANGNTIQSIIG